MSEDTATKLAEILSEFNSVNETVQGLANNLSRLVKGEAEKHVSNAKSVLDQNPELKKKVAALVYLVDADDFAQQALWEKWHQKISWEESREGVFLTAGFFGGQPVTVSFTVTKLNEKYVAFYYPSGTYADWNIVKEFLKKFAPGVPNADAKNFHNVLSVLRAE